MAKKARRATFKPPAELTKQIDWMGPRPLFLTRGLLETDEGFAVRQSQHEKQIALADVEAVKEMRRRLTVLAAHMGVDIAEHTGPLNLCFALAKALCPVGFSVDFGSTKRGRGKVWTYERYFELIADVEMVKRDRKCNDTTACRTLINRAQRAGEGRYLPPKGSNREQATSTLLNRLAEARNIGVNPYARVMYYPKGHDEDTPGAYEEYMKDAIIQMYGSTATVRR